MSVKFLFLTLSSFETPDLSFSSHLLSGAGTAAAVAAGSAGAAAPVAARTAVQLPLLHAGGARLQL